MPIKEANCDAGWVVVSSVELAMSAQLPKLNTTNPANPFPIVVQPFQDDDGASDKSSLLAAEHMRAIPIGAPALPTLSECRVQGTAVITSFRYDPSLFNHSFIADMCVEFESLVKDLGCADATKSIREL
ncbi:acetyl-CoA synthetase-like protein [Penicillium canariense]|uniref:Acetyl-CoA synthetase-like protein n=1 Tax=Penicillium canariense TaxID=189055 RepID=A0A9W9I5S2_9EURO|nr:acetyl-CoA synthetase-like protein [Penicillium canariense]KAJ5167343.1 acetyl-CoA synthetase-like protein [Penicillium canariense]